MSDLETLKQFVASYKTKSEAARALGMSPQLLSDYLSERIHVGAKVREKLQAFGYYQQVPDGWSKVSQLPRAMRLPNVDESVEIPMLLSTVSAGDPRESFGEIGAFMKPARYFNEHTFAIQASGESMTGAGIVEGHWLIIDTARAPKDGDIVVVRMGDKLSVKRYKSNGEVVLLHPENNRFKPIPINTPDVEVMAVVLSSMVLFR